MNTDIGQTGRVRCFYGLAADKKSGLWSMALTQYTDAAAAQKQVDLTISNESDNGAQIIPTTVNDYPATIAIREGGLIIMAYDTWTMAIATIPGDRSGHPGGGAAAARLRGTDPGAQDLR